MMTYNDLREQDYSFPSSDPIFFKLEIFKIQDIIKIKISKFIYKCLDKNIPINFRNWFTLTTQKFITTTPGQNLLLEIN